MKQSKSGNFFQGQMFYFILLWVWELNKSPAGYYSIITASLYAVKLTHMNGCFSRLVQTRLCVYILINMVTKVKSFQRVVYGPII